MAEEIAFENGRISNFEGLMSLPLHHVTLHTIMHHSSTSTYTPNFTEIGEMFVDVRTYRQTDGHLRWALLGLCRRADLKMGHMTTRRPRSLLE